MLLQCLWKLGYTLPWICPCHEWEPAVRVVIDPIRVATAQNHQVAAKTRQFNDRTPTF
jgi:hypothetical protein